MVFNDDSIVTLVAAIFGCYLFGDLEIFSTNFPQLNYDFAQNLSI
jgi:hypothetical protein